MSTEPKLSDCPQCGDNLAVECQLYGMASIKPSHRRAFADGFLLRMNVCTKCGKVVEMWVDNPDRLLP